MTPSPFHNLLRLFYPGHEQTLLDQALKTCAEKND